jgi:2-polyprenyl-6-methoxyphenol hydroxylase-like FAD-dependent oxidoreductase
MLHDPGTMVEAFADGWWYTAGLPEGRRFFACMTDTDIGRALRFSDQGGWLRALETSPHIRSCLPDRDSLGPISIHPSGTRWTSCPAADGWLAVGDAASTFDPLSSLGITKAIRSGIFAAYTIGDVLTGGDDAPLEKYLSFLKSEFHSYLETRRRFYTRETRWVGNDFWRRRMGHRTGSGAWTGSRGSQAIP